MIATVLLAATLGALVSVGASSAQPTYRNPVYGHDFPDPFVLSYGGRFYAYATESGPTGFQVMDSPDLVHWTHRGIALTVPWSKAQYWAPEVVYHDRRFFMTYSALNPATNRRDIGVATSDKPLGSFEHRAILVRCDPAKNNLGVIDATVFFDRDGQPYIFYSEEYPRRIVVRRLSKDLLSAGEEVVEVIRPDHEWEHGVTEAPTVILRNGVYHLFYSGSGFDGTKKTCRYAVCHATARSVRGPWTKDSQPILRGVPGAVYGPGHQCVIRLASGEWWMVYHGWDNQGEPQYGANPVGRTLRIDRLQWRGDVPYIDGPTTDERPAPKVGGRSARR